MASKQNKRFCLSPNKRALPVSSIPRGALCPNATSQTRKKGASLPQKPSAVSWILKKSARNVFDLRRLRQTQLILQFVFPFSSKFILAPLYLNITAQEDIDIDADEDISVHGTSACLSKLIIVAIVNAESASRGYAIGFAAGIFASLQV